MRFDITDIPEDRLLKISVFSNPTTPDLIGSTTVGLDAVLSKGEFDEWVELKYKDKYAGEVYLEMTFYRSAAAAKDIYNSQRAQQRARPSTPTTPTSISSPSQRMLPDPPIHPVSSPTARARTASPLASPVHHSRQQSKADSVISSKSTASRYNIYTDDYNSRVSGYATMPARNNLSSNPAYSPSAVSSSRRESYPQSNPQPQASPPRKLPWTDNDDSHPSRPPPPTETYLAPRLPYPDIAPLSLGHRRSSPSLMASATFDNSHRPQTTLHHKAVHSSSHGYPENRSSFDGGVPYSPYDPLGTSPERRSKPASPSSQARPLPQPPTLPGDIPRAMRRSEWEAQRRQQNGNIHR